MGFRKLTHGLGVSVFLFALAGCPVDGTLPGSTSTQSAPVNPISNPLLGNPDIGYISNPSQSIDEGAGYVAPPPRALNCQQSQAAVLTSNQILSLDFNTPGNSQTLSGNLVFSVTTDDTSIPANTPLGVVTQSGQYTAFYTAPSAVAQSFDVLITASDPNAGTEVTNLPCTIRLLQDGDLGIGDDGHTQGVVGNVFPLPTGTSDLINPATMTSVASILTPNLNVPDHDWTEGFPGLDPSFNAWFEIDFNAQIYIPEDGDYQFRTDSDDGSIVFIAGRQVVNNDGVHAVTTVIGPVIHYSQGWYTFEEWYYQGPPVRIANMVYWRSASDPAAKNWSVIPPDALARPNTNPTN
jgi:hypothetical protein